MEKLAKDISEIIVAELKTLNDKVKGLNFLELLKASVIDKLFKLVTEQKIESEQLFSFENRINQGLRNIKISINYFNKSISITKKIIEHDSLLINFNEAINYDIYKDEKNFSSILVYKNTGISIPKDTVINSKYNKNVLLIEILNIET